MRSKFWVSAAIASLSLYGSFGSVAQAAGAKAKVKDAHHAPDVKPLELHADDKSIKKQTQWEDKVMGPDSKRSELDKIARARAINEKAQQDKEKQAALEATEPAPKPAPATKKNEKAEVSLIAPEKIEPAREHEISPKLETAAAQAKPAPSKPADDKFIDKLLRDGNAPTRKTSASDKDLEALLSGAKEKPHKKGDSVDDILRNADKGPAMPAPRAQQGGLPEWAKQPEITSSPPPPPPVALAPAPSKKKNDGVIQVVQGAAGNLPAIVSQSNPSAPPARGRKAGGKTPAKAAAPVAWSDPFAEKSPVAQAPAPKKEAASHPSAAPETGWNDPFAVDPAETRKSARHAAPTTTTSSPAAPSSTPKRNDKAEPSARPANWKDPFTKAPTPATRPPVAMRELGKSESGKWDVAARRTPPRASASDSHAASGWGVLKKRAR